MPLMIAYSVCRMRKGKAKEMSAAVGRPPQSTGMKPKTRLAVSPTKSFGALGAQQRWVGGNGRGPPAKTAKTREMGHGKMGRKKGGQEKRATTKHDRTVGAGATMRKAKGR